MPAPFCAVGILQDFVYCSPGLPAYLAFVWTEFCSFKQFLQKDNRREKKRRIHVYVFISFHESIVDHAQMYLQHPITVIRIFSQMANGAMSIFDRNNQETPISLNVKSPITEMGIDDTYDSNVSKHFSALGSRSRRLELVSKILLLQPDGGQE